MKPEDDAETSRLVLLELTTDIVTAYIGNHSVEPKDLPKVIEQVFGTLEALSRDSEEVIIADNPAVPIDESVTDDVIICLEDGLPFKSLKRHLRAKYNLTPDAYRAKWGLPPNYPMVAPNYAKERSKLARQSGLGRAKKRT